MAVVERILAIQAQDPRGFRLAVRSRSTGLTVADVERALTVERSLVVTWLNRGTLHLVRREDYWWLHALTNPQLRTANERRLAHTGVSPHAADRGVGIIARSLGNDGPLDRDQLRTRLDRAGVPTTGQALVHLLLRASLDGLIVRGPVGPTGHAYALVAEWLGPARTLDRDTALAELARRYLAGHGPATDGDLAAWAGIGRRDARAGLLAIDRSLEVLPGGLVDLAGRPLETRRPSPRLLGPFDPILHGWRDRSALLPGDQTVVTSNGVFRPVLLAGGRAVATWSLTRDVLRIAAFAPQSAAVRAATERDAAAVGAFLGRGSLTVAWP